MQLRPVLNTWPAHDHLGLHSEKYLDQSCWAVGLECIGGLSLIATNSDLLVQSLKGTNKSWILPVDLSMRTDSRLNGGLRYLRLREPGTEHFERLEGLDGTLFPARMSLCVSVCPTAVMIVAQVWTCLYQLGMPIYFTFGDELIEQN